MDDDNKLGATRQFTEGELRLAVGADLDNKKVVIDFGKLVAWVALSPQDARQLAEVIRKTSYLAEGRK